MLPPRRAAVEVGHPRVDPFTLDDGQRAIHDHTHGSGTGWYLGVERVALDGLEARQIVGKVRERHEVHGTALANGTDEARRDGVVVQHVTQLDKVRRCLQRTQCHKGLPLRPWVVDIRVVVGVGHILERLEQLRCLSRPAKHGCVEVVVDAPLDPTR